LQQKKDEAGMSRKSIPFNSIETNMAYTRFEQSEEAQREELIRKIEASVRGMSIRELEALCYELSTKNYISERM